MTEELEELLLALAKELKLKWANAAEKTKDRHEELNIMSEACLEQTEENPTEIDYNGGASECS
jgi:hypothetical protein